MSILASIFMIGIYLIFLLISVAVMYFIIKIAVKNAIIEAHREIKND